MRLSNVSFRCHRATKKNTAASPKQCLTNPGRFADYIAAVLDLKPHDKQRILEAVSVYERLSALAVILAKELDLHELESKIQNNAQAVINKGQREYYLREQLKAIQTELGEADDLSFEIDEMREQLHATEMPDKAKQAAEKELKTTLQNAVFLTGIHGFSKLLGLAAQPPMVYQYRRYVRFVGLHKRFLMRITTIWKRLKSAFSSISPYVC